MVKKSTILVQASLSFILGLAVTFGLTWALVFDLLKDKLDWSAQQSWPFFGLIWALLALIWLWHVCRKSRERLVFLSLAHQLLTLAEANANIGSEEANQDHSVVGLKKRDQAGQLTTLVNQIVDQFNQAHDEQLAVERSKDEMMTNISHDLRTPLTAIIGYLGLVVNTNGQLDSADQDKYLETAYHKSNQMKTLVEDLFSFAKLQSTQVSLNISDFSLGDLLEQILANYAMDAKDRNLKLATAIDPQVIVMAGDSDKIARALINLVENALKYGQGASFIKLTGQMKTADQVEIRVINDGPMIPPAAANHIFERFYRVEESRNSKTGGTGLGLAIVKGIVDQHRGQIHVESTEDLTAFVMTLPLKQVKEERENE